LFIFGLFVQKRFKDKTAARSADYALVHGRNSERFRQKLLSYRSSVAKFLSLWKHKFFNKTWKNGQLRIGSIQNMVDFAGKDK